MRKQAVCPVWFWNYTNSDTLSHSSKGLEIEYSYLFLLNRVHPLQHLHDPPIPNSFLTLTIWTSFYLYISLSRAYLSWTERPETRIRLLLPHCLMSWLLLKSKTSFLLFEVHFCEGGRIQKQVSVLIARMATQLKEHQVTEIALSERFQTRYQVLAFFKSNILSSRLERTGAFNLPKNSMLFSRQSPDQWPCTEIKVRQLRKDQIRSEAVFRVEP